MTDQRDAEQAFKAMWRRMLADPAAVDLNKANFDYAMEAVAPGVLTRMAKMQACFRPTPQNEHQVLIVGRLDYGRRARLGVLPRAPSARTVDFGDGLALRFARHPAAEYFMTRVLPKDGVHEPELVEYLKRTLRHRDVVVDIGAHTGYVSCVAAALGATVIAVEMQPTLIPMIQLNAALNDLWSVHPLCAAIGDRNGMVPTYRINPSPGTQSAVWHWETSKFPFGSVNHDCIPCLTLDSLFPGPELPSLVKVDVEGAEGRVLAGAGDLIRKRQTRFMVEVHAHLLPKYGTRLPDLLAPFEADGWTLSMLTTDGLRPLTREAFVDPEGPIARHAHNAPVLFEPRSG
ncbi:hypothetical protein GCM10017083_48170 [Thalassobaculum fulvum]|uniref:Methyltransferase FkbM domain-containing protein n=1 Tax=Thalassobaculum fulvum TaxID=1633335 RepID=A0A919CRX1_9PROT|nr:FkbM family methyltransferase [Thalassobaculum fulvum]GHD61149.1 hypothetical protein GCM10017083_48170 [Thalassobaculum fulvum]